MFGPEKNIFKIFENFVAPESAVCVPLRGRKKNFGSELREAKIFFGSDWGRQKFFLARIEGGKNFFWLGLREAKIFWLEFENIFY